MITKLEEQGTVIYSEDALANIVGIILTEIPGVLGTAAKNAADGFWSLLQKENYTKGISIKNENDGVSIEVAIIVAYGTKFSEVANNIISRVKHNVENLTELKVNNVTVSIQGVKVID